MSAHHPTSREGNLFREGDEIVQAIAKAVGIL
jgi:hypothetical protein